MPSDANVGTLGTYRSRVRLRRLLTWFTLLLSSLSPILSRILRLLHHLSMHLPHLHKLIEMLVSTLFLTLYQLGVPPFFFCLTLTGVRLFFCWCINLYRVSAPTAQSPHNATPYPVPQSPFRHSRGDRNARDANEVKASRKADIEHRCQSLSPPIPSKLLRHMDSFKAAIQIAAPLTDQAWEMLAPRLISQREAAEEVERSQAYQTVSSQIRNMDKRPQESNHKEAKDVMDREWDDAQRPIRDRLASYADDIIREEWRNGEMVNRDNASRFAAAVLIEVRKRYMCDSLGLHQNSVDNGSKPSIPHKLVLDSMKWVFDNKIKHITERYRKDLFLCSSCEGNFKFYGFEGVIMHYAAKHTNQFSNGNVVVSWKEAEWPEEPPFHADPVAFRNTFFAPNAAMNGQTPFAQFQFGGYSRGTTATPGMQSQGPYTVPQYSPAPGPFMSPFPPPNFPPSVMAPGYDAQAAANQNALGSAAAAAAVAQAMAFQGSPANNYASLALGGINPLPMTEILAPAVVPAIPTAPAAPAPPALPEQAQPRTELDRRGWNSPGKQSSDRRTATPLDEGGQVSMFANVLKEQWMNMVGVKDLPNSVRLYVTIKNAVSAFRFQFEVDPDLKVLMDALSYRNLLAKSVKSAQGLSCKACHTLLIRHGGSSTEDPKLYNAVSLVSHFGQSHVSEASSVVAGLHPTSLDWKEDMIQLPDGHSIAALVRCQGMDEKKLRILADAFPEHFSHPLPRLDKDGQDHPGSPPRQGQHIKPEPGTESKATPTNSGKGTRPSTRGTDADSPRLYPGRREDEYDPRRPALETSARGHVQRPSESTYYRYSIEPEEQGHPVYYEYHEPVYYVGDLCFFKSNCRSFGRWLIVDFRCTYLGCERSVRSRVQPF